MFCENFLFILPMDLEVLTVQVLLGEVQRPVTPGKRKNYVTRACTHVVDDDL
jgi:hypothetical protein